MTKISPEKPNAKFIEVLETNDIDSLKSLIASGENINAILGVMKCTPLMIAVRFGLLDMVSTLLEAGADVNAIDRDSANALFYVTEKTSPQIIDLLVKYGIDINKRSRFSTMAIHAVASQQLEVATMLIISAGTDLSLDKQCHLLMEAMDNGSVRMFQMLLMLGAPNGCTVFLEAACQNSDAAYVTALKKQKAPLTQEMLKYSPHKFGAIVVPIQVQ
jgi:ankyrin repeat protein